MGVDWAATGAASMTQVLMATATSVRHRIRLANFVFIKPPENASGCLCPLGWCRKGARAILRTIRRRAFFPAAGREEVYGRGNDERKHHGNYNSPDHGNRQGLQHLRTSADRKR